DNYQRQIFETELFPKKESQTGQPVPLQTLDLAYYPDERGAYNYNAEPYNSGGVSAAGTDPTTGKLLSPQSRWGGIMRKIETNDFEAANVQFVQLWMMDPFNGDLGKPENGLQPSSGELIVQLGNVSEDVLRDGKKAFENGLPTSTSDQTHPIDTNSWGYVPKIQSVVNAFDSDPTARAAQDVGLDGLSDVQEQAFFSKFISKLHNTVGLNLPSDPYHLNDNVFTDPSTDYYSYYRSQNYDDAQANTLQRYKHFNGMEGNSPITTGSYPTSSTTLPNSEDINRDNNLSEDEGYYQYRVKISPSDITSSNVGNNFINDMVQGNTSLSTANGAPVNVKWYQIKIPIQEFEAKYGNIEDFKSIRFIRMIMRGFSKPVVLRLAKVELIRGEWRKYAYNLADDGEYVGNDNTGTSFSVSAVNYEENGTKTPVNYVLPPNIEQQLTYGPSNPIHMNEQAMALKVCGLQDGDARATYKNVDFDVRSYKKMRMYVHAEGQVGAPPLRDNDLTCFIRLGSDFTQNYYEYEVPLYVTAPGTYDNGSTDARYQVWRAKNEIDLEFSQLQNLKQTRNADLYSGKATLTKPYEMTIVDPEGNTRHIYIKGNPNLSELKTIMIGVRNPKRAGPGGDDDGLAKCAEVWVNELRLSDFNEKGGWASTAHVTAKLADLGTLTLAGNYSTPGWGSIDKKVSQLQRSTNYTYDISSQLALHKFLPAKWGINLPMFIGYSQARIIPQYNPLDPDIYLKDALAILPNDSMKKDLKNRTIDVTERKSINFTNVKKERPKNSKRNNIYDIENFSFNFSYSRFSNHSAMVQFNNMRDYRGGFVYGYSTNPKNIQPFKNIKILNKKIFAIIKDFNFNPYPGKYSFLVDVNRHYAERLDRNTTGLDFPMDTFYDKRFTMLRSYDTKWDLTKSLKLDFHADNNSRIFEPQGAIDTKSKKDEVKKNLFSGGNNTMYSQRAKVDYAIPINKIPITDWITASAGYSTDYKWVRALYSADSLGNTIQNGNQKSLNTQGNMATLYNKVPFLKKVNAGIKRSEENKKKKKAKLPDKNPPPTTIPPKNPPPKNPQDTTKKPKKKPDYIIAQYVARTLMMLKNVSLNMTQTEGMVLSGFNDSTRMMGLSPRMAPGPGFVFGQQHNFGPGNLEFTNYAASKGWVWKTGSINTPFTQTQSTNITGRANLEPLPGFKIELTGNQTRTKNNSEFFRWGYDSLHSKYDFLHQSQMETGNFSMSFNTWKTAFEKTNNNYTSKAFTDFLDNRSAISQKLAGQYGSYGSYSMLESDGKTHTYFSGYGPTSQTTLMYAFLAAYSGKNASTYSTKPFPNMPSPNWRVTYDGLSKIKQLKKYFKTITISHAYRSSYSFSYTNNLESKLNGTGQTPHELDANNNFMFYEQINSVSIVEQFAPLIKVDMTLQNSLQFNVEIKKDRNLSLSFSNNQLTEIQSKEYVFGTGYKWKNLVLKNPFSKSKGKKSIKSDLNLKEDFSIRQNLTLVRKVDENYTYPSAGQTIYSLKTSADYMITQRITARLFFDWLITNPRISTSFKSSNIDGGISIRFTLS
ncbi:MAG TPA: cell surface protein SprA, partial [Bacteroidia bacterium]